MAQRRRWYNGNFIIACKEFFRAPCLFKRAFSIGVCEFIRQIVYMLSNFRGFFNFYLVQVLFLEGVYLWGGLSLACAAAMCFLAIILLSTTMTIK